ncbi:MAG: LPS export ABC transporter permease LptF [Burkholderiales bacterium]
MEGSGKVKTPIFDRALITEFAKTGAAVFSVLLAITLTTQFIRFLGQAAKGKIDADQVLAVLGFTSIRYLAILLSLTLFISVLTALTRSYRDSEMIVWFSSGASLTAWVRPVLIFAAPVVCAIAALSLFVSPWASAQGEQWKERMETRDDWALVAPGVFRESRASNRVFFVEDLDPEEGSISNIFVHTLDDGEIGITVAKQGTIEVADNGDRFLVLHDGRRYEGPEGSARYQTVDFESYAVRIEPAEIKEFLPSTQASSTWALLASSKPTDRAELWWRLSLPLSALVLALIAIPLSFVNPRAGRSLNLVLALLIYMTYSNFLSVAQAWGAQGRIDAAVGLFGVHAVMLAILLLLFYHRLSVYSIFRFGR